MCRSPISSRVIGTTAMTFSSYDSLTRLARAAACMAAFSLFLPAGASAQSSQVLNPSDAAGLSVRLSTLEDQVRQLNGQIEQMTFQMRQLQDQLRRVAEDTEYRFQELGHGGGTRSTATVLPPQTQIQAPPIGTIPPGAPPQTLGQVPAGQVPGGQGLGGQPLDLSAALGQPLPETVYPQQPLGSQPVGSPPVGSPPIGSQPIGSQPLGGQPNPQLALAPSNDPKDVYDLSYGYILRGEFDLAEASFRQFLAQYPGDPLAGNAQYWVGESLFARGMYREAADAFLNGYSEYPEGAKAPESLYKLGMSLKELGQVDAACSTFLEIARRYPQAPQAVQQRTQSEMQKSGC